MNLSTRPPNKLTPEEIERERDKRNEETKAVVDDFLSEMRRTIRELQETSHPERKDFPLASALKRSHH